MNDTTSTPDEPDGRGRVATGEQAAIPQQANGAGAAPDAESGSAAGTAGANGAPSAQSGGAAAQSGGAVPQPHPRTAAEPEQAPSSPQAESQSPAAQPARPDGAAAADPPVDPMGADAPTAQLNIPRSAQTPGGAPESPGARPLEPDPAPGPIPGPGPEAAAPPPWDRMAGPQDVVQEQPVQQPPEEPGGLLDEGPTAFLEPPSYQDDGDRRGAASSSESEGAGWSTVRAVRNRPPRQAVLQLKRFDPWSALKLGLVLAVVLFFIWLVAVGVLYGALDGMGVWDRLNGTYADLVSGETPAEAPLISAGRVFGFAAVIGAINSLLFAVAVTVGAFVYNVSADLVGGIEVTLSERD